MENKNVGACKLELNDSKNNFSFPLYVFYPTNESETLSNFGPFQMELAQNAKIAQGKFKIAIISHGSGGSPFVYRTIAKKLAQNGYIVAMPEHYKNNKRDNSIENTIENLIFRPETIHLSINAVVESYKDNLESENVAVIGHSMGGYTALAIAGGIPSWSPIQTIETSKDERVKKLILMAPAACWFPQPFSLENVNCDILMYTAEFDKITPRWQSQLIIDHVPDSKKVIDKFVKNADHLSFLSPFPPNWQVPAGISNNPNFDRNGFDRADFHKLLHIEITEFLNNL